MMMKNFFSFVYLLYFIFSFFFFFFLKVLEKKSVVFFFSFLEFSSSLKWMEFMFTFDWMGSMFMMVLFMISGSVGFFSLKYMAFDLKNVRFFFMLNLFILSMVVLILFPHYMFFVVGWDGLGFTSFLLMKYYKSANAWTSSLKTFLINRLGDGLMLASFGLVLWQGHFSFFFEKKENFLFFFFFLGLLTKSAHFPFSLWLPSAMAAPTPVSALVHSSTLVTAGMYMLLRLMWFVKFKLVVFFLILAMMTVFLGSLNAFISFDSKKVVAFSTLSNLGLLGLSVFFGLMGISFFHLLTHGVSKALLFISVGKVMKNQFHNQDLRMFSKTLMKKKMKVLCGLWSILSLMGFFFLSCFFSKDYLLEVSNYYFMKIFLYKLLIVSLIFTFLYSFRLISFFLKKKKMKANFFSFSFNLYYIISFFLLLVCSVVLGSNLNYFILYDVESIKILKFLVVLMLLVSFWQVKLNFKFILKLKYFSGIFFFFFVYLGKLFQNVLDFGLFSYIQSWVHYTQESTSTILSLKSEQKWSWKLSNYFMIFVLLLFFFF